MLLEPLETRSLLSATLDSATGLLTITGTDKNDAIRVYHNSKETLIVAQKLLNPDPIGKLKVIAVWSVKKFLVDDVKAIEVNAGKGNDSVSTGGSVRIPLDIPSTLNGQDGNDFLTGGNGKDVINGGAGKDDLRGLGGDDQLNGGDGNDRLYGGRGADVMRGDAGNDFIDARDRAATDVIDGGTNDPVSSKNIGDRALFDTGDTISNVEKLLTAFVRK